MQNGSEARLAHVEAKCRVLARLFVLFVLVLGVGIVAAAKGSVTVEAQTLTLRSANGDKTLEVRTDADGDVELAAYGSGVARIALRVTKKGPELTLNDSKGASRIRCFVDENDSPRFHFLHGKEPVLRLLLLSNDHPAIALDSTTGRTRAALALAGDLPQLRMFTETGEVLWEAPK